MKPMALVGRKSSVLHEVCVPVLESELPDLHNLAGRMLATCRVKGGIAIAAPQVGVPIRMIVQYDGHVIINPEVELDEEDGTELGFEGCLSIPGRTFAVERHINLTMSAWNLSGQRHEYDATGMDARMIQHELDHLNGVIIADIGKEVRGSQAGIRM